MPTMDEMFRGLYQNPMFHTGLGLLLGSQKGGPGPLAGMMQGMQSYGGVQDAENKKAMQKLQLETLGLRKTEAERREKAAQAGAERQTRFAALMGQNPQALASNPLAQAAVAAGYSPEEIGHLSGFNPRAAGQGGPKIPFTFPLHNPDNTITDMIWDEGQGRHVPLSTYNPKALDPLQESQRDFTIARTGEITNPQPKPQFGYVVHRNDGMDVQMIWDPAQRKHIAGEPYIPTEQQRIFQAQDEHQRRLDKDHEDFAWKQAEAADKKARANLQEREFEEKQRSAWLKQNLDVNGLTSTYKSAMSGLQDAEAAVNQLLVHPGFDGLFGIAGKIDPLPGSKEASAAELLKRIVAMTGVDSLADLKSRGVVLSPMTDTDRDIVMNAGAALGVAQSDKAAEAELKRLSKSFKRTAQGATEAYGETMRLYQAAPVQLPSARGTAAQAPTAPGQLPGPDETELTDADITATMRSMPGVPRERVIQGLRALKYKFRGQ